MLIKISHLSDLQKIKKYSKHFVGEALGEKALSRIAGRNTNWYNLSEGELGNT